MEEDMENLKEKLDLIIEEFCKENGYVCEFDDNNEIMIDMCKNHSLPSIEEFFYNFGVFVATKYPDYIDSFKPSYYYDGLCPELVKDMTKKERKAYFKTKRVLVNFNTGTRIMKSDKFPNRLKQKKLLRKMINENKEY